MARLKSLNLDGMRAAVGTLPRRRVEPEVEEALQDHKDLKRQTLYLPFAVHDQLRDLAHVKRISQQELFRRALDMLFESEGLRSWDELRGKRK